MLVIGCVCILRRLEQDYICNVLMHSLHSIYTINYVNSRLDFDRINKIKTS